MEYHMKMTNHTVKVTVDGITKVAKFKRLAAFDKEIITWEVLSEDKKLRIGIISQLYSNHLNIRMGLQQFKVKYWLGSRFYPQMVCASKTMADVVSQMLFKD